MIKIPQNLKKKDILLLIDNGFFLNKYNLLTNGSVEVELRQVQLIAFKKFAEEYLKDGLPPNIYKEVVKENTLTIDQVLSEENIPSKANEKSTLIDGRITEKESKRLINILGFVKVKGVNEVSNGAIRRYY